MTLDAGHWDGPPLSTASIPATNHYRHGIAALVAGSANADRSLEAAIAIDPGFALAHIALAVCRVVEGEAYVPWALPAAGVGRGERQHAEIVQTMLAGDRRHAADLRREHLLEFPGDLLIVWLPMLRGASAQT
jgi:hypothetical protein